MPAQQEAPPIDTPFSRLRERLDKRETGEGEPSWLEALFDQKEEWMRRRLGPLANLPFFVLAFGSLGLGLALGYLFPWLEFLGKGVVPVVDAIATAAPMIIFFTLTPALVRMYSTASAGKFALVVVAGFVVTTTVGGLFALLVSLVFFPDVTIGLGARDLGGQLEKVGRTSLVVMTTNPLFRAIWGAVVASFLLYFGGRVAKPTPRNPVSRTLRSILDIYVLVGVHFVSGLGRVIKAIMPVILLVVGIVLVAGLGSVWEAETAGLEIADPPWSLLEAFMISAGVLVLITLLWLALVSFAVSEYTKFPIVRLIKEYLLTVYPFAWATSSSAASIPINITSARDGLGVRPEVRNFVIPFGATVNLDGTMMAAVVGTIVAAKMVGYDVSVIDFLVAMIPLILITIGTPGVPTGLAVFAGPVMAAVLPLPPGTEGLFASIFFILLLQPNDNFRTAVNVLDNGLFSLLLDKWYPTKFAPGADVNPWLPVNGAAPAIVPAGAGAAASGVIGFGEPFGGELDEE